MQGQSEYAQAGVDYTQLEPFKMRMRHVGEQTAHLPARRGVRVYWHVPHAHGAIYSYEGRAIFVQTQEGLGNKSWVAEWMYRNAGDGRTYHEGIGVDTALMAVNDALAQGALPVIYTDEVAAEDSGWFADDRRAADIAKGFLAVCQRVGMAMPAGESPALRYLIQPGQASFSGCVVSIISPPERLITGEGLRAGDVILGATSSGIHANGLSLVIKKAMALAEKFLTKLPNGNTLGEETLVPTRSYVKMVEMLLSMNVRIHAILPGTGSGVAKVAFDKRPFTYRIHTWPEVPLLFRFMQELGVSLPDLLTTFNWGVGYYLFVPPAHVGRAVDYASRVGYDLIEVGRVEEGERKVIFEPEGITLPPPGE